MSIRHASYVSEARLSEDPEAAEIALMIERTQPVSHPADAGAVWRLALVYLRIKRSAAALDEADAAAVQNPGTPYADSQQWRERLRNDHAKWIRLAGEIESQLGRTPASRAKLGLHIALGQKAMTLAELHELALLEEHSLKEEKRS